MTYVLSVFLSILMATGLSQAPPAQNAFRIVVLEGEDAVNIIQQKTAVAPLVEVRDRNNIPVAGATVTFAIGGNSAAFAGGVQTLTVVTNAAGQAVAAGISPVTAGAMQINVTAAFQGQTAVATITQTNFVTAAQAASAASSAGSAGGAGGGSSGAASGGAAGGGTSGAAGAGGAAGGAGAAGGGLSGLAIGGIVGGAAVVAGGAIAVAGGGDDSSSSSSTSTTSTSSTSTTTTTTPTTSQPTTVVYNGPISGIYTSTGSADTITCTFTYNVTGTMRIELTTQSGGTVSGPATGTMSFREAGGVCTVPFPFSVDPDGSESGSLPFSGTVTGTTSSLRFSQSQTQNIPISGGTGSSTFETSFTGSQSGNTITGQLALLQSTSISLSGFNVRGSGTGSMTVTLSR